MLANCSASDGVAAVRQPTMPASNVMAIKQVLWPERKGNKRGIVFMRGKGTGDLVSYSGIAFCMTSYYHGHYRRACGEKGAFAW